MGSFFFCVLKKELINFLVCELNIHKESVVILICLDIISGYGDYEGRFWIEYDSVSKHQGTYFFKTQGKYIHDLIKP